MNNDLVAALMSRRVLSVAPDTLLEDALAVMARERASSIVVVEGRQPVGVVTERDVVRLLSRGGPIRDRACREVMSSPVQSVSAAADYREAYHLLSEKGIRHLLVTDDAGNLIGMLTESDLMRHLGVEYFISLRNVGAAMTREVFTLPPEAPLAEALLVMGTRRISSVVVVADGRPVGIVTERDAVGFSIDGIDPARVLLRNAMSAPVRTVPPDHPLHEAVLAMEADRIRRLVVVDEAGRLAGILTRHDVVKGLEGRYLKLLKETIERQRKELEASRRALEGHSLADHIVNSAAETVILVADLDGRIIFCNPAAEPMLGFAPQSLPGRGLRDLYDAAGVAAPDFSALIGQLSREGKGSRLLVLPCRGRHLELAVSALREEGGQLRGLLLVGLDTTDRMHEQEALRLADKIVDSIREGMLVTDAAGTIVSVNAAFTAMTGFGREEAVGRKPSVLASGRHPPAFYAGMWRRLLQEGHWAGEVWNRRRDGAVYPQWLEINSLRDGAGRTTHYIGMMADLSERKAVEQRLEYLAYYDSLTGLPNRTLLRDRMDQALMLAERQGAQVALLSVDLDLFKHINDTLGQSAGDQLLAACAQRIQESLRTSDTIARYAGDQFLVMLPTVPQVGTVSSVAQKIVDCLHAPFRIDDSALLVTASVGVSLYPGDGGDFDTLARHAEAAMYEAKQAGRDTFRFFDPAMNRRSREHVEMQARLRQALDREEFVLHYQPQFDIAGERIVGVEALLRWQDPEKGLVPPGEFVPLAEESGLIVPIGAWVLRRACLQAKAWQDAGHPAMTMAVNLSALQFRRGDLFATVVAALDESGLSPDRLELELTESILIHETERVLGIVRELKSLGVQLSIDDFGTGYSSLAYLKRFAVDKLKIDRSFVRDLETDLDDAAIVRAIVQMAHGLKLKVIAEGVETERQLHMLRVARCDEVQGFHFSRPLPARELEALLRQP